MHPAELKSTCTRRQIGTICLCLILNAHAIASDEQPHDSNSASAPAAEFVDAALVPFWRAREIREPVFFIQRDNAERPTAKLLFKPAAILSVTDGTRESKFESGKDFVVDMAAATITRPPGSRIPVTDLEHLYPLMTSDLPKIARRSGDRKRGIFWDEGSAYHKLQIEVTYRPVPGGWNGPTSEFAGESLPKTIAKLRGHQPVKIVLCGDSISLGSNASQFTKVPPYCPPFGQLTALGLEKHFGSKVTFINAAVDGTTSKNGLQLAKEGTIGKQSPDLVIIAFGMNDFYYRHEVATYQSNIRGMIEAIRAQSPDAEFILVAPMLANAERGVSLEKFPLYRDALAKLCGHGVALADVTSIWTELQKRKSFYDLTGNGVNHPNDFGHCVYAQAILALLVDKSP